MNSSSKISVLLLAVFLFGAGVLMYGPTLQLFPSFIHAWTQSDRYAIALRFLDNGFDLFHPATFNYQTVEGVTRVDFPINEYIVALFMKISGSTSPAIFRCYTFCISIGGLIYLFLLSKKLTGSRLLSLPVVFFVFLSPVYFYYQAGFLPSIPAISCLFAAYYYFVCYRQSGSQKIFILSVLFFLLAALMRFPFIIFFFAMTAQCLFIAVKTRKFRAKELFTIGLAFLLFGGYYLYNVHLGRIYGSMFLDTIMPPRKFAELKAILSEMYHHWGLHYLTFAHYVFFFVVLAAGLFRLFRGNERALALKEYWRHFLIAGAGAFFYFLLMARQFVAHDYYFLDSLFVPLVLFLILALGSLPKKFAFKKAGLIFLTTFFVVIAGYSCWTKQEERYTTGAWDRTEITRQNFTGTAAFLDANGISEDAKILVIDAYTTNAPLILMNRKGYTVMGTTAKNIALTMAWAKWDYVAIQDAYLVSDVIHSYPLITSMLERVAGNGKVSFYKKSDNYQPRQLRDFLGFKPENTLRYDDTGLQEFRLDANTEYGYATTAKDFNQKGEKGLKVLVEFWFLGNRDLNDIRIVTSQGSYYQDFHLSDYFRTADHWQHAQFQFTLPDDLPGDAELKVYLWNPGKKDLSYKYWNVLVYK